MIRHCRRLVPWLLLCACHAQAEPWADLAEECLASISQAGNSHRSLDDACPEASEALRSARWGEVLARPTNQMSPWSLVELTRLADYYAEAPRGPELRSDGLRDALDGLPQDPRREPSLWERLRDWFMSLGRGEDESRPGWLENVSVSPSAFRWIWWITTVLIVLAVAAIVVNEVRHHARRRVAASTGYHLPEAPGGAGGVAWEPAPRTPAEQLAAMYRRLVARLEELDAVPRRPASTHRETVAAAAVPETQRTDLARVGMAAERTLFGGWSPDQADVDAQLATGDRLLRDLGRRAR